MRVLLLLPLLLVAAAAGSLPGTVAYMRCGSLTPLGVCAPGSVELAALHLATGSSSLVLALPNATGDTLELQNLTVAPAADALFVSVAGGVGGGQLLRLSLRTRAVVSARVAPACAFLAVDDVRSPAHALCLTDAPYYGVDGRSYLLRVDLEGGAEPAVLATWGGSPVPIDVVAAYNPRERVLYTNLLDEATDGDYLLGWDVTSGRLVSQVALPPSVAWVSAAWDASGRMLGVVTNYSSAERVVAAVDLASGAVVEVLSTALTRFETAYAAAWAPAVESLLVTVLGSGNALRLVGVNATSGQLDYDGDASGLLGSFAPVGDSWRRTRACACAARVSMRARAQTRTGASAACTRL